MSLSFVPARRLLWAGLTTIIPLVLATWVPGLEWVALAWMLGLAGVVVLDAYRSPRAGQFEVERRHDPRLSLAEANPVDIEIRWNLPGMTGRPRQLYVRDEAPVEIPNDGTLFDGTITPGGSWTGRYHLSPRRRGDYPFGAVVLRVASPLGLLFWQRRYELEDAARVYPNLRAIARYDLLARRGRLEEAGLRRTRRFGSGTEFERLRDYLPDDDYRRINWKATARRRQPVTVEYETERSQNLVLVLDTGRLMGTPVGRMQKLDYAVNAALMLAYVAMEMGDRTALLIFTDRTEGFVPLGRGKRQFQLLLDTLYKVETHPIEADPTRALNDLLRRQLRRSLIVVFTDVAESVEPTPLLLSLGQLARRHLPLCVMVSNPDITRLAVAPPSTSQAAYEKVIAQRLIDERRGFTDRLERRGTLVLDAPAEQLTTDLINRYLEIKAKTKL
ncbi:MAG TPA: DUF58 domain-containing protein [Thermomicrobiales bacterium]|nr:DUF58 domain-containing protein [Thermomicrobiales bacterium]